MNRDHCYRTLNIDKNSINKKSLRNAYYKEALKYHPDKNTQEDTTEKFQEINKSYEYLMNYHNFNGTNNIFNVDDANDSNFSSTLHSFFTPFFDSNMSHTIDTTIISLIVEKIKEKCEGKAIDILKKFNYDTYKKIYNILYTQKDILHIPDSFFEKLVDLYKEKSLKDKTVRIYPLLSDLLDYNVYKLIENKKEFLIPLWHHELIYDNDGGELMVQCFPKLEKDMEIDEINDIHIYKTYILSELWDIDRINITIGKKTLKIEKGQLKMISKQTISIPHIGIPRINSKNVYDFSKRGAIHIHFNIE